MEDLPSETPVTLQAEAVEGFRSERYTTGTLVEIPEVQEIDLPRGSALPDTPCKSTIANPLGDDDGDQIPNQWEIWLTTDPSNFDTNGDGISDYDHLYDGLAGDRSPPYNLSAIRDRDTDRDGLPNGFELCILGTHPSKQDTDYDLFSDGREYYRGDVWRSMAFMFPSEYSIGPDNGDLPAGMIGDPLLPQIGVASVTATNPRVNVNADCVNEFTTATGKSSEGSVVWNHQTRDNRHFESYARLDFKGTKAWGTGLADQFNNGYENTITVQAGISVGIERSETTVHSQGSTQLAMDRLEYSEKCTEHLAGTSLVFDLSVQNIGNAPLYEGISRARIGMMIGALPQIDDSFTFGEQARLDPGGPARIIKGLSHTFEDVDYVKAVLSGAPIALSVVGLYYGESQAAVMEVDDAVVHLTVTDSTAEPVEAFSAQLLAPSNGVSMARALASPMFKPSDIEFRADGASIRSVRGVEAVNEAGQHQVWIVNVIRTGEHDETTDASSRDIRDWTLRAGDHIYVNLISDDDEDGLADDVESYLGTDPSLADTDGDGIRDGAEVAGWSNETNEAAPPLQNLRWWVINQPTIGKYGNQSWVTNPLRADTDEDGVADLAEAQAGRNPAVSDLSPAPIRKDGIQSVIYRIDPDATCRAYLYELPSSYNADANCDEPVWGQSNNELIAPRGPWARQPIDVDGDGIDELLVVSMLEPEFTKSCADQNNALRCAYRAYCTIVQFGENGKRLSTPRIASIDISNPKLSGPGADPLRCGELTDPEYRTRDLGYNIFNQVIAVGNFDDSTLGEEFVIVTSLDYSQIKKSCGLYKFDRTGNEHQFVKLNDNVDSVCAEGRDSVFTWNSGTKDYLMVAKQDSSNPDENGKCYAWDLMRGARSQIPRGSSTVEHIDCNYLAGDGSAGYTSWASHLISVTPNGKAGEPQNIMVRTPDASGIPKSERCTLIRGTDFTSTSYACGVAKLEALYSGDLSAGQRGDEVLVVRYGALRSDCYFMNEGFSGASVARHLMQDIPDCRAESHWRSWATILELSNK